MAEGGDQTWTGTRTPNRAMALAVIAIAIALIAIAAFRWSYFDHSINWWFMTVFVVLNFQVACLQ